MRQTINIGTSPNDGTGDPLRTAFDKTNDNFLEVYADGGGVITVTDPTTSTDAPLNDALQNIFDSGGGATPNLQQVTDEGNQTSNSLIVQNINGQAVYESVFASLNDGTNEVILNTDRITVNGIDYSLPSGASSPLATLADITGGGGGYTVVSSNTTAVNDTNYTVVANATFTDPSPTEGKGYVVYVRNGTATIGGTGYAVGSLVFRVFHSGGWSTREYKSNLTASDIPTGIDATKIADGSVSNTEFQYLNGVTGNIQTQIDNCSSKIFNNTNDTPLTGITSETIYLSEEVIGGTLKDGSVYCLNSMITRGGRLGTCTYRVYYNTANNLTGATLISTSTLSNNIGYGGIEKNFVLKSGQLIGLTGSTNSLTSIMSAPLQTLVTYNPALTYYWIVTIQQTVSADNAINRNFSLIKLT